MGDEGTPCWAGRPQRQCGEGLAQDTGETIQQAERMISHESRSNLQIRIGCPCRPGKRGSGENDRPLSLLQDFSLGKLVVEKDDQKGAGAPP